MVPGLLAIQLLSEIFFDGFFCRFEANFAPFWDPIRYPIQDPPSGGSTEGYVVQLSEGRAGGFQKRTSRATGTSTVDHGCW